MLSDAISSATTSVKSGVKTASSSLSSAISNTSGTLSKLFGALTDVVNTVDVPSLPLDNPLHQFSTYNYILGFGCLSREQANDPDGTYMSGSKIDLICKGGNIDYNNRVSTAYGKFDFHMNNLEIEHIVGFHHSVNSTFVGVSFDIVEPYSMGLFLIACQQKAAELGHTNFREAPFVLTIEFRGNTDNGQMIELFGSNRFIPITITDIEMSVDHRGCVYRCNAMGLHLKAITDTYSKVKTDVSIKGKTVQELLQTGEKSLQAVVNNYYQQFVDQGLRTVPDEVLILFPASIATASSSSEKETSRSATTASVGTTQSVYSKLGVSRSNINSTMIQQEAQVNAIGTSSMGFSSSRSGDAPIGKDNEVWDEEKGVYIRKNNTVDEQISDFRFSQDTSISSIINQVILNSEFVNKSLDSSMISESGMKGMWSIEVQTYLIGDIEESTGLFPKLFVYRVIPYKAHASHITAPNTKVPGFDVLKQQVIKHYKYIYTGQNVDIMNFTINMNNGFVGLMSSDTGNRSIDAKTYEKSNSVFDDIPFLSFLGKGKKPTGKVGEIPSEVEYSQIKASSDQSGGGGSETPSVRAARLFMDTITSGAELFEINLEILGDPYFLASSGIGNYVAAPTQYDNLNSDGTMNYQNGEVDILVDFRSPIDIHEHSGLFQFGGVDPNAVLLHFSGLCRVTEVVSSFRDGKFTQRLSCFRRIGQEYELEASSSGLFNTSTAAISNIRKFFS